MYNAKMEIKAPAVDYNMRTRRNQRLAIICYSSSTQLYMYTIVEVRIHIINMTKFVFSDLKHIVQTFQFITIHEDIW